jgi:hypothetical protein
MAKTWRAIFLRSEMKRFISSLRVASSGARRMEDGWTVAMTKGARSDFRNSPRCRVGWRQIKWEPRGKRRIHKKPNAEMTACRPWLDAEPAK